MLLTMAAFSTINQYHHYYSWLAFMDCFLRTKCCHKHLQLGPRNNPRREAPLSPAPHIWGNWGTEKLRKISETTKQEPGFETSFPVIITALSCLLRGPEQSNDLKRSIQTLLLLLLLNTIITPILVSFPSLKLLVFTVAFTDSRANTKPQKKRTWNSPSEHDAGCSHTHSFNGYYWDGVLFCICFEGGEYTEGSDMGCGRKREVQDHQEHMIFFAREKEGCEAGDTKYRVWRNLHSREVWFSLWEQWGATEELRAEECWPEQESECRGTHILQWKYTGAWTKVSIAGMDRRGHQWVTCWCTGGTS